MFKKCPFCGSTSYSEITPSTGTSYILTEVDTTKNPPNFLDTCGLPVKVMGCLSCKGVHLVCESIFKK